jgi:hypothetical protein
MPRLPINYSNTIIYKLVCNNPTITDVYVGHTTDFIRRKTNHKCRCNTEKNNGYNCYVYQFIRDNGGWDNWSMVEIEKYSCNDIREAEARERHWLETLGATLNMVVPTRTRQEHRQENRDKINEYERKNYYKNREKINEKKKEKIVCECGAETTKSHLSRHCKSSKHLEYLKSIK